MASSLGRALLRVPRAPAGSTCRCFTSGASQLLAAARPAAAPQQPPTRWAALASGGRGPGGGAGTVSSSRSFSTAPEPGFFGKLKDKVTGKVEENQQRKAEEIYKLQVVNMVSMEAFCLSDFKKQISDAASEGGVTGWKSHIPGVKDQPMVQEMQKQLRIMDAMTESELAFPKGDAPLGRREKLRISSASGEAVKTINELMDAFENTAAMQSWLRTRHLKKLPLPATMAEAQKLAQHDRRFIMPPFGRRAKKRHR